MDAALPQLGPGTQPADSPLRGAADTIPVEKESLGQGAMEKCRCPQPYSVGIYSIAGKPNLIPEAGCGQSPRKKQSGCFIFGAKKSDIPV